MSKYTHSEDKVQADCFLWLRNTYRKTYGLCFHIPNGGRRTPREALKFKSMGVVAGIPDLFLAVPAHKQETTHWGLWHGLFIEMKTDKGRESKEQIEIHAALRKAGYKVETCRSLEDFKTLINDYLKNSDYIK